MMEKPAGETALRQLIELVKEDTPNSLSEEEFDDIWNENIAGEVGTTTLEQIVNEHINDENNPHNVTAADVGALSVAATILFDGEASSGTVTLSETYINFKYLVVIGYTSSNNQNANSSTLIPVSCIDSSKRWVISHSGPLFLTFTSTTVIALDQAYNYSPKLMKIIGIK